MGEATTANINKQALVYGIIVGIIYIILQTVENMFFVDNFFIFYVAKFVGFFVYLLFLGIFAASLRKMNGGYITFKKVFGAIFIMILIAELLYYIYSFLYVKYIDPQFIDKCKNAMLAWMEKRNVPQSSMDEAAANFDKQSGKLTDYSVGPIILRYFQLVILDSLFGLIVAGIVKKNEPILPE